MRSKNWGSVLAVIESTEHFQKTSNKYLIHRKEFYLFKTKSQ